MLLGRRNGRNLQVVAIGLTLVMSLAMAVAPALAGTGVWSGYVNSAYGPRAAITGTWTSYTSGISLRAYTSKVEGVFYRPGSSYISRVQFGAAEAGPSPDAIAFYGGTGDSASVRWSGYKYPTVPVVGGSARGYSWVPSRHNIYMSLNGFLFVGAKLQVKNSAGTVIENKTGWTTGTHF